MSNQITFHVPGLPRGKGRAKSSSRIGRDPRTGAARVFTRHYTPEATAAYESLVKLAAAQVMAGREPYTGAIQMHLLSCCRSRSPGPACASAAPRLAISCPP